MQTETDFKLFTQWQPKMQEKNLLQPLIQNFQQRMNHLEDRRSIAAEVLNDLIVYETDEEE